MTRSAPAASSAPSTAASATRGFPKLNTVDGFDSTSTRSGKKIRARYLALHDLAFPEKGMNPLFVDDHVAAVARSLHGRKWRSARSRRRAARAENRVGPPWSLTRRTSTVYRSW